MMNWTDIHHFGPSSSHIVVESFAHDAAGVVEREKLLLEQWQQLPQHDRDAVAQECKYAQPRVILRSG